MTWRYQPVWREADGERVYSLCEVYFDEADRLKAWTESPAITPHGETQDELCDDLERMWIDARRWKPVAFEDLKVGMTFEASKAPCSPSEGETAAVEVLFSRTSLDPDLARKLNEKDDG